MDKKATQCDTFRRFIQKITKKNLEDKYKLHKFALDKL